jgi:hypothetical protein
MKKRTNNFSLLRNWFVAITVAVLLASGESFAQSVSFSPATLFTAGSRPASVAIGDFNGDGKQDLAVASIDDFKIWVLLGTGTGSFGAATFVANGDYPTSVVVRDFNSDGKSDLAFANNRGNNISILLGNGTGSFGTATNLATGSSPGSIAIGDFNGDGKPDLAVTNAGIVSIFLGKGDGTFLGATNFGAGSNPIKIAIGDFNGDGKQDLAVVNAGLVYPGSGSNVSILLGTGTGAFGLATNFAVGLFAVSVTTGDFNGDGKPDLAVANDGSNNVSILLSTGTGSFGTATNFPAGRATDVAIGDFNSDGKLDLAVVNEQSAGVSILLGTGTGSFVGPTKFLSGSDLGTREAIGDFNSDGKPDIAMANSRATFVSIFLNNTVNPNQSIVASTGTNGTITPSGAVSVNNGGSQSFVITPNTGYHVADVLVDGSSVGAVTSYTFTNVTSNHTISATFVLANTVPVANAGSDQMFNCTPAAGAIVTLNGSGSTDADGDVLIYNWSNGASGASPIVTLAPGIHTLTLTVNDSKGGISSDNVTITINADVTAPVPDVANLPTITGECSATVVAKPTATDACSGSVTGTTSNPLVYSSQGTFTITWTYSDANGNSVQQTQSVVVKDVTPPIITSVKKTISLWPADHKYETIKLSDFGISVSDNCASITSASLLITKVTSDEVEDSNGNGDGNTLNDILIAGDFKSVNLRKEREGTGNGRVYTIYVSVSDGNGNVGTSSFQVQVPHDKKDIALNDGSVYEVFGGTVIPLSTSINSSTANEVSSSSLSTLENQILPESFELKQNYPNPFNPTTTISYQIPEAGYVTLKVYDMLGREVATLVNEYQQPGNFVKTFHGTSLPSGIYFYRLQVGDPSLRSGQGFTDSKKMLLIK